MLGHRQLLPSLPRRCTRSKTLRSFSTSSVTSFPRAKREGEEQRKGEWSASKDPTWAVWKKTIGKQFEKPRPCNWLGGKVVESISICVCVTKSNQELTHTTLSAPLALPAKPILQASDSGFGCAPECIISGLHCQSGGQLSTRPCHSVSSQHQTRGCHPAAQRPRRELVEGSCTLFCLSSQGFWPDDVYKD